MKKFRISCIIIYKSGLEGPLFTIKKGFWSVPEKGKAPLSKGRAHLQKAVFCIFWY